ncbi:MAG: DNA polymerase III subunit delta [Ancalomicrobiaceae bacterium]|nr:DNA polymerase III subunit delta [Ancalomicrobiaceae bacterium]
MVALKTSEIDGFCARPPERATLVLVFGPDDGLVSERAKALVKSATKGVDDPFSLVRLTGSDVTSDPMRLVDEALTVSLFGTRRVVWVKDAEPKSCLEAIGPLLAHPDPNSLVVIEAGDLKKTVGLRKQVEDDARAIAIACYADTAEDLRRLIESACRAAGVAIAPEARELLESLIGGDRLASRGEIEKLLLYVQGKPRIDSEDVLAIVGDASAIAMDELVDAVAAGDVDAADLIDTKLAASGTHVSVSAGALIRHFQLLQRLRLDVDGGLSPSEVTDRIRPPLYFRRKPLMVRQLGLWSLPRIDRALSILDEAMLQSRLKPALASAVVADAFLAIARAARAARPR